MLGYVLVRQPTVILRRKSECLDMCTSNIPTMILPTPFFIYNCNNCNVCNVCNFDADLLFSIYYQSVMSVIRYRPIVFDFIS